MLFPGCQLDNLVLINKIKEQLMAEKIRPPHLPAASAPSQQPLLAPPGQVDSGQQGMTKAQQMHVLHNHSSSQPDIALHARPTSSSVTGEREVFKMSTSLKVNGHKYYNKKVFGTS